jgi:hypothetical protein
MLEKAVVKYIMLGLKKESDLERVTDVRIWPYNSKRKRE